MGHDQPASKRYFRIRVQDENERREKLMWIGENLDTSRAEIETGGDHILLEVSDDDECKTILSLVEQHDWISERLPYDRSSQ